MRALVYTGPGRMEMRDEPRPPCGEGEVAISVAVAGICGADLSGFLGRSRRRKPPLVFGHELVGRTAEGRRVLADPLMGCGRCAECLRSATNLCAGLRLLGMDGTAGCFADYAVVPENHVHEIPTDLSDARAILAEPLANIVHLFRLTPPVAGARIGIVGAGLMGTMALRIAVLHGAAEVLVEDLNEARLETARHLGAEMAAHPESGEIRRFAGRGLDLVVDACGEARARQEVFDLCRPGGTVVLLGMASERSEVDFGASIRKEHRAAMSFGYTAADFQRSLELLVSGEIDLTAQTTEMPLEEGQAAFERMTGTRDDVLKMMLRVA